ncbi:hypothetical protein Ddc_11294 [Ditylenchus destructor]|nr:hypothetical protein Ddc_11294 [Ditylenchus destructor]
MFGWGRVNDTAERPLPPPNQSKRAQLSGQVYLFYGRKDSEQEYNPCLDDQNGPKDTPPLSLPKHQRGKRIG